jgi:acetolactate synthase-1/2/3 large subunit
MPVREDATTMKNYLDGGEAILEAFRKLKIDYIMSSPGSEWSPLWEALARQQLDHKPGPTFVESWHETLAVNMATGYTLITGRPQAVLLHAAVGMLQGSMGVHGAPAMVRRALGRRHRALRRAVRQVGARRHQPPHAL